MLPGGLPPNVVVESCLVFSWRALMRQPCFEKGGSYCMNLKSEVLKSLDLEFVFMNMVVIYVHN